MSEGAAAPRQARTAYLFLSPGLALFFLFVLIPVVAAFYLSFCRYDIIHAPTWIGLKNYARIAKDLAGHGVFYLSVRNTAQYAIGTIPIGMALALGLALLVNAGLRGVSVYRTSYYLPVVTSLVAVSMVWMWLYDPSYGLLNYGLELLSRALTFVLRREVLIPPQAWIGDPGQAMAAIVLMSIWRGLGYNMVIYLAGLQGIPNHLYEAAIIDGATPWQRFWAITWPLLKPTTAFILVVSVIGASQVFAQVYVMTNGGPNNATTTIVHQIFQHAFSFMKMGYASAMAFVLFGIIFVLSLINLRLLRGGEVEYA
ncbi:MAG: sugar ABC transporter permease [Armatimonadota bacterium]|nr:sugar ABC transporter permease [Armatimonadota bacterium]